MSTSISLGLLQHRGWGLRKQTRLAWVLVETDAGSSLLQASGVHRLSLHPSLPIHPTVPHHPSLHPPPPIHPIHPSALYRPSLHPPSPISIAHPSPPPIHPSPTAHPSIPYHPSSCFPDHLPSDFRWRRNSQTRTLSSSSNQLYKVSLLNNLLILYHS